MKCAIIYKDGKFRFRCGDVKFEVYSNGDTSRLFDVLSALLIFEKMRGKCRMDEKWVDYLKQFEEV